MNQVESTQKTPAERPPAAHEALHNRLYTLLMWLFIEQGVSRRIISKVFRLNKGSVAQLAFKGGWASQRKAFERQIMASIPFNPESEETPGAQLAPWHIAYGINANQLGKQFNIPIKTLQSYFTRNKVTKERQAAEEWIAHRALYDAVQHGILPKGAAEWVPESVKKAAQDDKKKQSLAKQLGI